MAVLFADYDAEPLPTEIEIHADNLETWNVFMAMSTQWDIVAGMGAATRVGLKYDRLPFIFDMLRVKRRAQPMIFHHLRKMESAALGVYAEKLKGRQ